eukprot:3899554-Pyramimonas_sp.AAC.1
MQFVAKAIRKNRDGKFRFRLAKLAGFKIPKAKRARLFKSGILPAPSFGVDVQRVAPKELLTARGAAGRAGGINERGCNHDMLQVLHPNEDRIALTSGTLKWRSSEWSPRAPGRRAGAPSTDALNNI